MKTFDPFNADSVKQAMNWYIDEISRTQNVPIEDLEWAFEYIQKMKSLYEIIVHMTPNGIVSTDDRIKILLDLKKIGIDINDLGKMPNSQGDT